MPNRILIVILLLVGALGIPLWMARDPAVDVALATAERGALTLRVSTNGTVEPVVEQEVRPRLSGRILSIREAGDRVNEGDELLRIDATAVEAELRTTKSRRLEAEESLRSARDARQRAEQRYILDDKLYRENALARERLVESESTREEARSRVAFLEREVPLRIESLSLRIDELEDQLAGATVRSTTTGTVYRADAEAGEISQIGQRVLAVADLTALRVRTKVDQVDLGKVRPGQPVKVAANAYPDRSWNGSVSEVLPRVDIVGNRAIAEALATVEAPVDGLVPGMNVDVDIVVQSLENVLRVPSRAIFASGAGPFVFRHDEGRAEAVRVETGASSFDAVEILSGLRPGDRVVLGPAPGLETGMKLHIVANHGERP